MMDHVWLVNAPVSTADARNLLLSLLSGFLSMPSVFLCPNSSKRTLLNRHKCLMSPSNPNFFSKYLNFFFLWGIDLARELTELSIYHIHSEEFHGAVLYFLQQLCFQCQSCPTLPLSVMPILELIVSHVTVFGK